MSDIAKIQLMSGLYDIKDKVARENIDQLIKLKIYTTPEEFGAVGDGVTDDTTAFLNALEYATTQKPQIPLLLSKTYLLSKEIPLIHGMMISGLEPNNEFEYYTCIKNNTTNIFETMVSGTWGITIRNIRFEGNNNQKNVFTTANGAQYKYPLIENCGFLYFNKVFDNFSMIGGKLKNLWINSCIQFGNFLDTTTDSKVSDIFCETTNYLSDYLAELNGSLTEYNRLFFTGNSRIDQQLGAKNIIQITSGNNCIFNDCILDYPITSSLKIGGTGSYVQNFVFNNLTVRGVQSSNYLIDLQNYTQFIVFNDLTIMKPHISENANTNLLNISSNSYYTIVNKIIPCLLTTYKVNNGSATSIIKDMFNNTYTNLVSQSFNIPIGGGR